jgi:hypothetical protein
MDKIISFFDYLNEEAGLTDLGLKVTSLELLLSKKLRKVLKNINHVISDKLLELHKESEPIYKQTFIDLAEEPDKVSFIQSNKVLDLLDTDIGHAGWFRDDKDKKDLKWKEGYFDFSTLRKNKWITDINQVIDLHYVEDDSPVWTKNRGTMKVSAFVNKVFGAGKFPNNYTRAKRDEILASGKKLDDIESFAFMFQTEAEKNIKSFELVKGDQILHYYLEDQYYEGSGNLGQSCMRFEEKNKYMKFYAENPDKVNMLILHPEQDHTKIIGRALVWNLEEPTGRKFMDRIYVTKDSYEYMFINYALNNKLLYKSSQSYGTEYDTIDGEHRGWIKLGTTLKPEQYQYFPYVDTLQYYNTQTGWISNNRDKSGRYVQLNHSEGQYYSA